MAGSGLGGGDQPSKTLKEGERVIAPSRRPDGTLRKAVRIRPGYTPPDEVPVYASKGALWKKEVQSLKEVPPGYDLDVEAKSSKSKSAKRNERKKEKRQQAAVENGEKLEQHEAAVADTSQGSVSVESLASQMKGVAIAEVTSDVAPSSNSTNPSEHAQDISKKIRALKKKIRLAEAQQQQDMKQEQLEKMAKLEGWRKELKLLEERNTEAAVENGEKLEQHEAAVAVTSQGSVSVESLASQMKGVAIAEVTSDVAPSSNSINPSEHAQDIGKKIRALKKKIRLAEAQQQQDMKQEQLEKMAKLEGWRKELKLLEDRNTEAAVENGEKLEQHETAVADTSQGSVSVESLASQMKSVAIAEGTSDVTPSSNSTNPSEYAQDISKKIRALKKKIRLAEAQQQQDMKQEQLEKMAKLEGWRKELKLLEDRNTEATFDVLILKVHLPIADCWR